MAKPIYALVGSDPFLQLQEVRRVLAALPADAQRLDVDGERAELADVLDELRSFAMFGGTKVVVVDHADELISRFREAIEEYCERPSDSAALILRLNALPKNQRIAKIIQKTGQIIECAPPKPYQIPGWIAQHAKAAHGLTVTPAAAHMMAELLGSDLGRVDQELCKLALQCPSCKVDVKDVQTGVAFQRDQQMWDLTDEIGAGDAAAAVRRWRKLVQMDSSTEFRAVTWLGMWLEKAGKALDMADEGSGSRQIAFALKIFPETKAEPFLKTARKLSRDGLYRALTLLVEIDRQSKSGVGSAAQNVERFILEIGRWLKDTRPVQMA